MDCSTVPLIGGCNGRNANSLSQASSEQELEKAQWRGMKKEEAVLNTFQYDADVFIDAGWYAGKGQVSNRELIRPRLLSSQH